MAAARIARPAERTGETDPNQNVQLMCPREKGGPFGGPCYPVRPEYRFVFLNEPLMAPGGFSPAAARAAGALPRA
jgi:hypothetical protein